ncbi:BAR-domain-containing protein [Peniophora sp. CONT]|nr:BAR-domain-containing protein [Peniophora sp. CONT]
MKGISKALGRTPHMFTTKVGLAKKSTDPEFDSNQRSFGEMEKAAEKLLKDAKTFSEAVTSLFTGAGGFAEHFSALFRPIQGEYDLLGKFPDAAHTIKNVDQYQGTFEELKQTIVPELELIESRIIGPVKELQVVLKTIRKMITKREHKLLDYDRHNNALTKLRDKKEKSLKDEQNLFKLEQDFEIASNEYEYINSALKADLPKFFVLATRFIDPLFHSFFYMQLNIFYMLLEKLNTFVDGKYDVTVSPAQIVEEYEQKRGDSAEQIEALAITQKFISTSKIVAQSRGLSPGASLGRSASSLSTGSAASRSPSTFQKKNPPPPPPSFGTKSSYSAPPAPSSSAAPPPYQPPAAGNVAAAAAAAGKRAPPPPPPLKPKPSAAPAVQYVVALYDFAAQADGDLSFNVGDRIEIVEKTQSQEDWWTGRVNGQQGVFPGNYVQET